MATRLASVQMVFGGFGYLLATFSKFLAALVVVEFVVELYVSAFFPPETEGGYNRLHRQSSDRGLSIFKLTF